MKMKLDKLLNLTRFYEGEPGSGGADARVEPDAAVDPAAGVSPSEGEEWLADDPLDESIDDDTLGEAPIEPVPPAKPIVEPPVEPVPAEAAPAQPVVSPVESVVEPVVPSVTPVQTTPPAESVPQPPQPATPPVAPQPTQAELQAQSEARRAEFRTSLVGLYKPGVEKVADNLLSEPAEVLSGLAADMHMRVVESAVNGIMAQLPEVIGGYLQQTRDTEANEKKFFDEWPQLAARKEEAVGVVQRFGAAYRQAHPGASMDDWIREVGAMTMVAMKIQPQAAAPVAAQPVVQETFAPAQPGAGSRPVVPTKKLSEWEELQQEFLQEDQV